VNFCFVLVFSDMKVMHLVLCVRECENCVNFGWGQGFK